MNGMVPLLSLPVTKVIGPREFTPTGGTSALAGAAAGDQGGGASSESAVMAIFERINVSFRQLTAKAPDSAYGIPGRWHRTSTGGIPREDEDTQPLPGR